MRGTAFVNLEFSISAPVAVEAAAAALDGNTIVVHHSVRDINHYHFRFSVSKPRFRFPLYLTVLVYCNSIADRIEDFFFRCGKFGGGGSDLTSVHR